MKNYLSFGGGVNSVAMYLYLVESEVKFEAVFVNHGTDWPETYEYFEKFQEWARLHGYPKITVLLPEQQGFSNLYDYALSKSMVPSMMIRWCTTQFKINPIMKYYQKPCFNMIGIDMDEIKRAKISIVNGVENRFPLLEAEMSRQDCKQLIKRHGLDVPIKSGCYICPFQRRAQWVELRMCHPHLFCKAQKLESKNMEYREAKGKRPLSLVKGGRLESIVDGKQYVLFDVDRYPPCNCVD